MPQIDEMRSLVELLNRAAHAYYALGSEIMSDMEYDALFAKLQDMETASGVTLSASPTLRVGAEPLESLEKAAHARPLLSLDKTKDFAHLKKFLGAHTGLLMPKLDGLTIVLRYSGGQLVQALTRGNGTVGEDVTHNARVFMNIPTKVPYAEDFEVRGEAIITLSDFAELNAGEEVPYKNPRNLASSAARLLNPEQARRRRVRFYAFGLAGFAELLKKSEHLRWLAAQGFECVQWVLTDADALSDHLEAMRKACLDADFATDGLVLTFDDLAYSEGLGATSHHPRDSMAFKWEDDLVETTILHIEWNTSRTGLINPVAVFEPVEIAGSMVSRASVHNVSVLQELALQPGDRVLVYKANMIIPQIAENLTRPRVNIPEQCPMCGHRTETKGDPRMLFCNNTQCKAQKTRQLKHFVSRGGLNIEGLSGETLDLLDGIGVVTDYLSLFAIEQHREQVTRKVVADGKVANKDERMGEVAFDNLVASIARARRVRLDRFLYALGIRLVGQSAARALCDAMDWDARKIASRARAADYLQTLRRIPGFGEEICESLHKYFADDAHHDNYLAALNVLDIQLLKRKSATLADMNFAITGTLTHYANRAALSEAIVQAGGTVQSSVGKTTTYLINNDASGNSAKNIKAQQLGVQIISEQDFLGLLEGREPNRQIALG